MVQLQNDLAKLAAAGVRPVGISYDPVEALEKFAARRKISFPLLSDPDSKVIKAYGLLNREMAGKKFGEIKLEGVPYPGTLLVGTDGVIRARLFVDGFRERHSTRELLEAAAALKK